MLDDCHGEAAGITIEGQNKILTMIQAAAKSQLDSLFC